MLKERLVNKFMKLLLLDPDEPPLKGCVTEGVMPKMIVTGDEVVLETRDRIFLRRCRTAASKGGYHVEEDGAKVGKSRM